jgi:lipid-A-disaccharide synthase
MEYKKHIMVFAAEKSGENHSYYLIKELKKISDNLRISAVGGGKMLETGITPLFSITGLNSFQLSFFKRIILKSKLKKYVKQIENYLKENKIDAFIFTGIADDTQYFVKALLKLSAKHNIKTAYYFSPHVWLWSKRKTRKVAKEVDVIFTFFPREEREYKSAGANTYFCGHPVFDELPVSYSKTDFLKEYNIPPFSKIIAFLPGSRKAEIKRHIRLFTDILKGNKDDSLYFICGAEKERIDTKTYIKIKEFKNAVFLSSQNDYYKLISCCDLSLTCSGTASLEAALYLTPQIVYYKLSSLDYFLWRIVAKLAGLKELFIGMPNIIAEEKIIPEFIHSDATAQNILSCAKSILETSFHQKKQLEKLKLFLGEGGGVKKAAEYAAFKLINAQNIE